MTPLPHEPRQRAAPTTFTTTLADSAEVARATRAFRLRKPPDFAFAAGQRATWVLPGGDGQDGAPREHTFSIASAPWEDHLLFATRMRPASAWKRRLAAMVPGAAVEVAGPDGDFTLHRDASRPAVFLAGGIGITPFRAMLRDLRHGGEARAITLFWSNRRLEDAPFLEELAALQRDMPGFRLVATMTGAGRDWDGERGRVGMDLLRRHLPALQGPYYYAAGPPAMVRALRAMLLDARVPRDAVRVEAFAGY